MSDYYELVGRGWLKEQHAKTGFPAQVADLSLSQYGGRRLMQLGQAVECCGYPSVGILPGCTAATYHVQAHSGPGMRAIGKDHPLVATNVHIDDVCMPVVDRPEALVAHRLEQ